MVDLAIVRRKGFAAGLLALPLLLTGCLEEETQAALSEGSVAASAASAPASGAGQAGEAVDSGLDGTYRGNLAESSYIFALDSVTVPPYNLQRRAASLKSDGTDVWLRVAADGVEFGGTVVGATACTSPPSGQPGNVTARFEGFTAQRPPGESGTIDGVIRYSAGSCDESPVYDGKQHQYDAADYYNVTLPAQLTYEQFADGRVLIQLQIEGANRGEKFAHYLNRSEIVAEGAFTGTVVNAERLFHHGPRAGVSWPVSQITHNHFEVTIAPGKDKVTASGIVTAIVAADCITESGGRVSTDVPVTMTIRSTGAVAGRIVNLEASYRWSTTSTDCAATLAEAIPTEPERGILDYIRPPAGNSLTGPLSFGAGALASVDLTRVE